MNDRPGYGDAEARRIIERAAEIDAEHGRQIDAPALREIAAEAGISALAVDRALQEHHSAPAARGPWFRRHPALVTLGAIAAVLMFYVLMRLFP
jgi:hypothetical protein